MKKFKLALLSSLSMLMLAPTIHAKTSGILLIDRSHSLNWNRSDGQTRCAYSKQAAIGEVNQFFNDHNGSEVKVKTFGSRGTLKNITNGYVDKNTAIAAINTLSDDCDQGATASAEAMCLAADELRNDNDSRNELRIMAVLDGSENDSPVSNCGGADWQKNVVKKYKTHPAIAFNASLFDTGGYLSVPTPVEYAPNYIQPSADSMKPLDFFVLFSAQTGGMAKYHYDTNTIGFANSRLSIRSKKGSQTTYRADVELELWNNSDSAMDLSDVTIRYYMETLPSNHYTGDVWYYDMDGAEPKIHCTQQNSYDKANMFCDVVFDKNTPSLAAGKAVSLEVVFHDHQLRRENMDDDYSNPSGSTSFTTNNKIVVYKNGGLVWGKEASRRSSLLSIASYDSRDNNYYIEPVISIRNTLTGASLYSTGWTIRYYFYSGRSASSLTAEVWYENVPGTPTVSCHDMKVPITGGTLMANRYCEVALPDGETILPSRYYTVDFGAWDGSYQYQESDWSWNGTTNAINKRIALFHDGKLMLGDIPR